MNRGRAEPGAVADDGLIVHSGFELTQGAATERVVRPQRRETRDAKEEVAATGVPR
jgi:hypothetical protein